MKQLIPAGTCMKCTDPCCHFEKGEDEHAPFFTEEQHEEIQKRGFHPGLMHRLEKRDVWQSKLRQNKGNDYVCAFFIDNKCAVYDIRPIECKLWPFFITKNPEGNKVLLAVDLKTFCPGVKRNVMETESGRQYAEYLMQYVQSEGMVEQFRKNPGLIHEYDKDFSYIGELKKLSEAVFPSIEAVIR